jgi:hypothetical protein
LSQASLGFGFDADQRVSPIEDIGEPDLNRQMRDTAWRKTMYRISSAFAAALLAGALAVAPLTTTQARADACLPTDHIDGSTADQAMKTMEAAGYMNPHDLKKGCDNYWYAQATKDGQTVDVVLPPGGQPFTTHGS